MTEGRTDPMTDKFISIEGITKRFAAPGGGSTSGMVRFAAAARSAGLGGTGEGVAEGLAGMEED